jgi:hypothetical protein
MMDPYLSMTYPVAIERQLTHQDYTDLTPWDRVRKANEMAVEASLDIEMRRLAGHILGKVRDVPSNGSKVVAQWIRKNFKYLQESLGIEVLQGPYSSLYSGVVDCDDAAILWMTLTRAAGLRTFFMGIAKESDPEDLLHAIGYDMETGLLYDLIDDRNYGNPFKNGLLFHMPKGYLGVYYSCESVDPGFHAGNQHFQKVGADMTCRGRGCGSMQGYGGRIGNPYSGAPGAEHTPGRPGGPGSSGVGGTGPGSSGSDAPGAGERIATTGIASIADVFSAWLSPAEQNTTIYEEGSGDQEVVQEESGIPTAVYVVGGLIIIGGALYFITRKG